MSESACSLGDYYAERAYEYDEIYRKPERQADLARLKELLPKLVAGKRVLEIAAGTGYWTQVLATSAAAVTATDLNAETIGIAAQRDYGPAPVSLRTADAYQLDTVPGEFDLVFCGFWWSHIARADIPRFLTGVRARTGPGAGLVLVDNRYVPGSSTPIIRDNGDTYQRRQLADGREYEIVKNFPGREQVAADLDVVATDFFWTELDYYWVAACTLR
jgi:protein-L-isoaspartate O-methyltransferase